ncbi:uncharacterized protein LOC132063038 isoform X2 [Lycium ferocissimum]|uniref:uncharacterized protein LOC132063038 isoform X2 n=1 Tax=Lycium ferocissimum TaxID=112874 RepID=UPI002814DA84|nr:uncharacterized protein LOC132063038 isoform X2 [Lycium ferocissimum]
MPSPHANNTLPFSTLLSEATAILLKSLPMKCVRKSVQVIIVVIMIMKTMILRPLLLLVNREPFDVPARRRSKLLNLLRPARERPRTTMQTVKRKEEGSYSSRKEGWRVLSRSC